jgi:hypothetical protein
MGVNPDEVARWLAESCQSQGVPVKIEDPVVLQAVVVLLGGHPNPEMFAEDAA